ncbi:tetratricopeptide repeat protein [Streptomyces sp. ISL-43]|uniref:tetratricopeptide repeat protein n=1 Tax=Streptomyces sp. ISL-43 TaxID=2819183 RepID=UPI001BE8FF7B|nr:tetratricopeptide repeat protein [Streptomyces sp. ISL-43]MBT2451796.1 tetratricopeptide repeat protein [Streptomyces sp. ISL-43]
MESSPGTSAYRHAVAQGHGRVFQAERDQHITEYHTHYHQDPHAALATAHPGPESVRVPLAPRLRSPVRDRRSLRRHLLDAAAGTSTTDSVHVVHGMPGCGKTAVAQSIFDEAVREHGVIGLWVNAAGASSLRAGMLSVALDRGAGQDEVDAAWARRRPPADLVWHYLDKSPGRWLLVLDNADDPALLEGGWLRTSSRGTTLVTTRHGRAPLWREADTHPLDVLDIPDAVEVLQDLAPGSHDRAALEALARELGCHPLALVLAGSFLGHQLLEPVSVDEYRRRLHDDPNTILDLGASPGERDVRRLISSTWQLSLDMLADQGNPEATTLIRLLSCFAADPLPVGLLTSDRLDVTALAQADPPLAGSRANHALHGLLEQSVVALLDVPGDPGREPVRCIQAHGLLLDSVSSRIPLDQRDHVLSAAATLLKQILAVRAGVYPDSQTVRLFVSHAIALVRRCAAGRSTSLAAALAVVRDLRTQTLDRGDYTTAHLLATAVCDTAADIGADSLTDRFELARALAGLGRFAEAAELHRSTLAHREEELGPTHPHVLDSAHALGLALYGLGAYAEDELHMGRAAEGRTEVLGSGHPDTIESVACLAEAIGEQERWAEAEALARPNLAVAEQSLGTEHPHTLISRITLAWVLSRRGPWSEAELLARSVIDGNEGNLGTDHPRTLAARDLLAGILLRQGRWNDAEEAARTVLAARERTLGPEHPHTLAIQARLARILTGAGLTTTAREISATALDAAARVLGPDHPIAQECRRAHREATAAPGPTPTDENEEQAQ